MALATANKTIQQYGIRSATKLTQWDLERVAFLYNAPQGLGRYQHFLNCAKILYPDMVWNPWGERILHALCDDDYETLTGKVRYRFISMTGCAAASKTYTVGVFASLYWLIYPLDCAVVLTSTTKGAMAMRVWPVIQQMFSERHDPFTGKKATYGNMVASQHKWQAQAGNDKYAIICQALERGDLNKAVENVKGQHTRRRLVVMDEANIDASEVVYASVPNARTGCDEFILIVIGNAGSKLDNHGRACEPYEGWNSITVESDEWKTKGIPEYQIDPGWCLHFDGEKSPNVLAGHTIYPYLYTWEDHQAVQRTAREFPEILTSLQYWGNKRGFWAASDIKHTVLSESLINRYDSPEKFVFYGPVKKLAGLDPGFGGDSSILQFGELGTLENGKVALQLTRFVELEVSATSKTPIDYQLLEKVKHECDKEGVDGSGFGTDSTGTGRGLADTLYHDWSAEIWRIEFGGAASDAPTREKDPQGHILLANQVYYDRVTELWWGVRDALTGGVLRGFHRLAIIEGCGREYEIVNRKYCVVAKPECKKRIHRSPDHMDAIAVLTEVARQHGLVGGVMPNARTGSRSWEQWAEKQHEVYEIESEPYEANPA